MCRLILPSFILRVERWKWNSEYRLYVSTLGNFKDEHKRNLPISINNHNGYCMIKTCVGFKLAHRIVMFTWKPIPNAEDLTVDHLNHNKRDNTIYNLEWVTKEENLGRAKKDLYIDKTQPKVSRGIIIKSGNSIFKDIDEAVDFCIDFLHVVADRPHIERKIKNAIDNNSTYCARKWKVIVDVQ